MEKAKGGKADRKKTGVPCAIKCHSRTMRPLVVVEALKVNR